MILREYYFSRRDRKVSRRDRKEESVLLVTHLLMGNIISNEERARYSSGDE